MVRGYGQEVRDLLSANGCKYLRPSKGSHELWWSPITKRALIVPFKIMSRHTANEVLKQAGIGKTF